MPIANREITNAKVAQLVEHDLAKVGVASSNLVFRSNPFHKKGFIVKFDNGFISANKREPNLVLAPGNKHLLRWWNW
jgi:hypothetical protein